MTCRVLRNESGMMVEVEESMVEILGWQPEDLVGSPSTTLLHPDDHAAAVATWFDMIATPGGTRQFRGRYKACDGTWRWVEALNTNHLDDPDNPVVVSVLRRITGSQMTVEEELRARKQIISRLADALPVGVFQIDGNQNMVFTNDRLHEILGSPAAATVKEQFRVIVDADRPALESGLRATFLNQPVDDLELRFVIEVPHPDFEPDRVCQVSLRPLTDELGKVTGAIGCLSDVTESVELRRELQIRASIDGLTGCLNRTATFELIDMSLRRCTPTSGLAVIFVDLDRFKAVNDLLGHAAGDHALVLVAEKIGEAVRRGDPVARIGGDEFLVICPEMPSAHAALPIAERLSEALRDFVALPNCDLRVGASVGLAWTNRANESPDALIARADRAMYESKLGGTGAVSIAG